MSASKHTPGPWTVRLVAGSYQRPALVVAGEKVVASCLGNQLEPSATSIREATANAHLIAAAPDMLTALQLVPLSTEWSCMESDTQDAVLAAIAKATGQ